MSDPSSFAGAMPINRLAIKPLPVRDLQPPQHFSDLDPDHQRAAILRLERVQAYLWAFDFASDRRHDHQAIARLRAAIKRLASSLRARQQGELARALLDGLEDALSGNPPKW